MYRNVRQAVVMVGGKGTRLRPLTYTRPKPILPVADKPCLGYLIDALARGGIEEVILACGYKSQQFVDTIGDGSDRGIKIRYSFEDEPMGTGGAIKLLEDELDDVFVACNGDVFADLDLKKEIDTHLDNDADITLALTPVPNPWEFGTAVPDETGRIVEFIEKPPRDKVKSNLINAGVYIVNKEMIGYIPKGEMYDFSKDLVPKKTAEGCRIWGWDFDGIWMDVGRLSDVIKCNLTVAAQLKQKEGDTKGSKLSGKIYLGKDVRVHGSKLKDCVVMEGCVIEKADLVNTVVMPGTKIVGARVSGSVIGHNTMVSKGASITDSIIGDNETVERNAVITDAGGA